MDRDKINENEAKLKIDSQMPLSLKCKKANLALCNDGTKSELHLNISKKITELVY